MAKYTWRVGGPKPKVAADTFGKIVEELAEGQPFGAVKARKIWEAARPPKSPIHSMFTWDNKKAGDLRRDDEARHYIASLTIVRVETKEGPSVSGRAFFIARPKDSPQQGYLPQSRILGDRDLRKQVLNAAKRELESYIAKYSSVLSLRGHVTGLHEIIEAIRDEIDQLEALGNNGKRVREEEVPLAEGAVA